MNKSYWFFLLALMSLACESFPGKVTGEKEAPASRKEKNVSSRDYSLTRKNSYSNLFLDSSDLVEFIVSNNIDDTLARRLRSFYNTRNYQFAWFSTDGLTEQANAFWNAVMYYSSTSDDTTLVDKKLKKQVNRFMTTDSLTFSGHTAPRQTELSLTRAFLQYASRNFDNDFIKRKELERFIPRKKESILYLADSLLTKKHKDNKYFDDINEPYRLLKQYLKKYYDVAQQGGWPPVHASKKILKQGHASATIPSIKKFLFLTGDLAVPDTTNRFSDTLTEAVKRFQNRLGLTANGAISAALIREMNVPVEERIKQILINMDRMRWLPVEPGGDLVLVNIPEFEMHVLKDGKKMFDMDIVVGKEGTHTMMFTGTLNQVIFHPYWNVPPSIVEKEFLPHIKKDRDYLEKNDMEITGENDSLPEIRQLPGQKNALGKVKFIFRNSFNIYFHDTPEKSLFTRDKRAFSHGCMRLREPEKMAAYLLRENPGWNEEKVKKKVEENADRPEAVALKKPVEVLITYYTAWVDEAGRLNFRDDIYHHDRDLAGKMFY